MMKIPDLIGQSAVWTSRSFFSRDYELTFGNEVIATLSFTGFLKMRATGESADGAWIFKRGFIASSVSIHAASNDANVATYRYKTWGGGTLEFPNGRFLRAAPDFWQRNVCVQDPDGTPLLEFKQE